MIKAITNTWNRYKSLLWITAIMELTFTLLSTPFVLYTGSLEIIKYAIILAAIFTLLCAFFIADFQKVFGGINIDKNHKDKDTIKKIVKELSLELGLSKKQVPTLFIDTNPSINAFATGIPANSHIVVYRGLIAQCHDYINGLAQRLQQLKDAETCEHKIESEKLQGLLAKYHRKNNIKIPENLLDSICDQGTNSTPQELKDFLFEEVLGSVIAHEIGHIKFYHAPLKAFLYTFQNGLGQSEGILNSAMALLRSLIAPVVSLLTSYISRQIEYEADSAACMINKKDAMILVQLRIFPDERPDSPLHKGADTKSTTDMINELAWKNSFYHLKITLGNSLYNCIPTWNKNARSMKPKFKMLNVFRVIKSMISTHPVREHRIYALENYTPAYCFSANTKPARKTPFSSSNGCFTDSNTMTAAAY